MNPIASVRMTTARRLRMRTGRVESSRENPAPLRIVPRSAIWKKKGRSSVGGEMSASRFSNAAALGSGAARAAKRASIA
jgi:hypothetical protein